MGSLYKKRRLQRTYLLKPDCPIYNQRHTRPRILRIKSSGGKMLWLPLDNPLISTSESTKNINIIYGLDSRHRDSDAFF